MATHQKGSRLLQNALQAQPPGDYAISDLISMELLDHSVQLFIDPYANYVFQKLIQHGRPGHLQSIVECVQDSLVDLSQDPYGTRTVQCLVHTLGADPRHFMHVLIVTQALAPGTLSLVQSANGNHVIQSCLTNFSCTANEFVHKTILENFVHVANNRYGCCVLQCCLKTGNYDQYQAILEKLTEHTLTLVKDAYGNYAVQFILDRGDPA